MSEKDKSDSDEKLYIEMSFFSKILCVNLCSFSWIVLRCINVLKKLFCIILYFFVPSVMGIFCCLFMVSYFGYRVFSKVI